MLKNNIDKLLARNCIIPAVHTMDEFIYAVENTESSCLMVKFGDLESLPELIKRAHEHGKVVMLHLDSIRGIARDNYGIKFLATLGVDSLITTKPQWIKTIRDSGMIAIQCMFLIDTEALRNGLESISKHKPDGVIIMPMSIPTEYVKEIIQKTGAKIIAGGLIRNGDDIAEALEKGIIGVATGKRELWNHNYLVNKR